MGVLAERAPWSAVASMDERAIVIIVVVLVAVVAVVILVLVAVRLGRVERLLANVRPRFSHHHPRGGEEKDPRGFYTTFDRFDDDDDASGAGAAPHAMPYPPPGAPMQMQRQPAYPPYAEGAAEGAFAYPRMMPFGFVGCDAARRPPPAPGMTRAEVAAKKTDAYLDRGAEPAPPPRPEAADPAEAAQAHYRTRRGRAGRLTTEQRRAEIHEETVRRKQAEYARERERRQGARARQPDFQAVPNHHGQPIRLRKRRPPPLPGAPPRRPPPPLPLPGAPKAAGEANGFRAPHGQLRKAVAAAVERKREEASATGREAGRDEGGGSAGEGGEDDGGLVDVEEI